MAQAESGHAGISDVVLPAPQARSTFTRALKYIATRILMMALMLAVGLYLAVVVINYGGFIDKIMEDRISNSVMGMAMGMTGMPQEEKMVLLNQAEQQMRAAYRLDEPFLLRCLEWTWRAATFELGIPGQAAAFASSSVVIVVLREHLPYTLLLAGTANLFLFFSSVFLALALSRRYGSLLDKLVVALSPLSSAPNWIYGVLLILIFAFQLRVLPSGGIRDPFPPETRLDAVWMMVRHMILPVTAIFLSTFFKSVYAWRTFFLINSQEDYVELGRAKGLTARMLERAYILRPTLPYVVTSFTVLLIGFWQEAIALEVLFNWPGVGAEFLTAMRFNDRPLLMGLVVLFAYLLALSVILLDIFYILIDPRVRLDSPGLRQKSARKRLPLRDWFKTGRVFKPVLPRPLPAPAFEKDENGRKAAQKIHHHSQFNEVLHEIRRYPTAIFGVAIILTLAAVSVYTLATIPYQEVIQHWRGDPKILYTNPINAHPVWENWFSRVKLPTTIHLSSQAGQALREDSQVSATQRNIILTFPFEYTAGGLPQDVTVQIQTRFKEKQPAISLRWITPDGRDTRLTSLNVTPSLAYIVSQDDRLKRRLRADDQIAGLFAPPDGDETRVQTGTYSLVVDGLFFEDQAELEAEVVVLGQVHGLAGTDHRRRDLMLAVLWGAPVALAFGLLGAVGTTLSTMFLASIGVWFGGWVDELIQRITEIVMILPVLPMALMVFYIYSKSIWAILGVIVLLNLFGSAIKNYRAIFLQIKESPFVEAAQVYGAGNLRIITRYLIPRIMPVMVPQLVILVPGFIFLEATLAYLGVSDIYLPTWGKVIKDAITIGAFQEHHYWFIIPISLLLITGLAFAMLGFSLDRVFNTRLKDFR